MIRSVLAATLAVLLAAGPARAGAASEGSARAAGDLPAPTRLRCEHAADPVGIDAPRPGLSWAVETDQRGVRQSAYRILAASSPERLTEGGADIWDSGRVVSSRSAGVEYAGPALRSGQRVHWRVRIWDERGRASDWSRPALWEMGLVAPEDWRGPWIRDDRPAPDRPEAFYDPRPAPLLRRVFTVERPIARARAYFVGLGYGELWINGRRVADRVLDPAWTDYSARVLYSTFDVTGLLTPGANAVGIVLGNGWFNVVPLHGWGSEQRNLRRHLTVGMPRARLQLDIEYADGTRASVATDGAWRWAPGPIVHNDVYLGEEYDARLDVPGWTEPGFDDSTWRPAAIASEPPALGPMRAQPNPPVRVRDVIRPVSIAEPSPGVFIADFGRNVTGWVRLRVAGPRGQAVRLRLGELLFPDGTLNARTSAAMQIKPGVASGGPGAPEGAWQQQVYTLRGSGPDDPEVYEPRFAYHGFRYAEITGWLGRPSLDDLRGVAVAADVADAGAFACSDPLLNDIHAMVRRTFLANLVGVQSDCPHREKFGYGGDAVASSEAAFLNFDMAAFYRKMVEDFADAQRPNGGFTETAPYVGIADESLGDGAGPVGWGTAHPLLCAQLRQYAGEERLIAEQYDRVVRWMSLLESAARDGILDNGIGDHESLVPKSKAVTGTAFYAWNARLAARFAHRLGRAGDARRFRDLEATAARAFADRFVDPATGRVESGTQCNQAMALALGLVPGDAVPAVLDALVHDITVTHAGALTTGIFGTKFMPVVLADLGRADVAHAIVTRRQFPGWGFMLDHGATTLWETWAFSDNIYSHNHPMFGSVDEWFYKVLAGIRPADDAAGFDRIVIRPVPVAGLTWVRAHHDSVRGRIAVHWRIEDGTLRLDVTIPGNAEATVDVPARPGAVVTESGVPLDRAEGVEVLGWSGEAGGATQGARVRVGSGTYRFESSPWP